jgi:hypothetical protein
MILSTGIVQFNFGFSDKINKIKISAQKNMTNENDTKSTIKGS